MIPAVWVFVAFLATQGRPIVSIYTGPKAEEECWSQRGQAVNHPRVTAVSECLSLHPEAVEQIPKIVPKDQESDGDNYSRPPVWI